MPAVTKPDQRQNIAGDIDDLRRSRRSQEIEAKKSDEHEQQKAPGSRFEKTIIKADRATDTGCTQRFGEAAMNRRMRRTKIFS